MIHKNLTLSTKDINKLFPINIKHLEPIINNITKKYPLINKMEIVFIVKAFFEVIREILISGKTFSINNLFSHTHLIAITRISKNKIEIIPKIKITTPRKMKK
jgi:hypothetical protein